MAFPYNQPIFCSSFTKKCIVKIGIISISLPNDSAMNCYMGICKKSSNLLIEVSDAVYIEPAHYILSGKIIRYISNNAMQVIRPCIGVTRYFSIKNKPKGRKSKQIHQLPHQQTVQIILNFVKHQCSVYHAQQFHIASGKWG